MKYTEVEINGQKIRLSPLTLGEWSKVRERNKGDDKSTELFIDACIVSAKKNHPELTEDYLRSLFSELTAGFLSSADGALINAILSDQKESIIKLEAEKRRLEELREEARLKREIEALKKEIGDL